MPEKCGCAGNRSLQPIIKWIGDIQIEIKGNMVLGGINMRRGLLITLLSCAASLLTVSPFS